MQYKFEIINNLTQWCKIECEWDELLSNSVSNEIFQTYAWQRTWWEHWGSGDLAIVVCYAEEKIACILPFYIEFKFGLKIVKFIGSTSSDYLDVIIDSSCFIEEVLFMSLKHFMKHRRFNAIELEELPSGSPLLEIVRKKKLRLLSSIANNSVCVYIPALSTGQLYEQYINKKKISRVKSRYKKLQKTGNIQYEELSSLSEADLNSFFELHVKRWISKGKSSTLSEQKYKSYFNSLSLEFNRRDQLFFPLIRLDGEVIACMFGFRYNSKIYYYIPTFNQELIYYNLGHLLILNIVNNRNDEAMNEIDLLRGTEPYKYIWTNCERQNYKVILSRRNIRGVVYFAAYLIYDKILKPSAKQVLNKLRKG